MALPSPQDLLAKVQGGASASLFSTPTTPSVPSPSDLLKSAQSASGNSGSFLGKLASTAGSFIKTAASKVGSFLGTQASNIASVATGQTKLTPDDFLQGIKQTASGIGTGIESLAIGFNEGVARIAKSGLEATIGKEATQKIAESPIGDFAKVATGRQNFINTPGAGQPSEAGKPLSSYQDIYHKARNYALDNNASDSEASTFGGVAVLGMLFADNPLIGPEAAGGKGLFKLSEESVGKLAGETSEDIIKATIKAENPALTDTELNVMAPVFREAKTPEEVRAAADQITKIQQAPIKAPSDTPNPDELLARSKENLSPEAKIATQDLPEPATPSYFRALDQGEQGTKFVPVEGQKVDIVPGVDTFIHQPEHGAYEVLEASTGRLIGKAATTPEEAVQSAQDALQGKTLEDIQAAIGKHTELAPRQAQVAPGSPQAVRASSAGLPAYGAPKPFAPELVRAISQETTPGPILDRLITEFPQLSEHALAPIASRLSKLKRTGDIEGILQVVRNISGDISRARAAGRGPINITKETLGQSIAKVGKKEAVGDLPPSIGQLLTDTERGRYLANISRVVRNPEEAVIAQQEYDALWEHADQRILDRYEELKLQRDMMREILDTHPGKDLNALYKGTFVSPKDVQLDELVASGKKRGADSLIGEIMQGQLQPDVADTVEQGQKALDNWYAMRDQLKELEAEIREIRPKAQAARVLQSMVEDVPVISRAHAGEIEALAGFEDVRKYKDISGFEGQAKDVYRIFEKVFGDKFPEVKKVILDPFDKSKGDMVDELKSIAEDLKKNVVDKYGFKRGSKESAAIQRYGDTGLEGGARLTQEGLEREFGAEKARKIIEADAYFRDRYNKFIDRVNKVKAEIYPNDPTKLIPRRKDYYRHFQELGDGFRALMDLFETPSGIDPQLAGLSEWTKPKSKFLSFAQQRLGKGTDIDAIGGFLDYAPSFAYAVHMDPHIGNFRYLRRRLSEVAPTPEVRELVPAKNPEAAAMGAQDLVKQKGINNFLSFLDDYANDLAGKTNPMDRYLQKILPGGRKTFRVIDWLNSRVKANAILGNLSSAVAQIFNVPNGIASAKLYSIPGLKRTLSSIVIHDDVMATSSFIKERYHEPIQNQFKLDWVEHPIRGSSERAKEMAAWITGALDEVGTKFIWQSHYAKGVAEGMADPVKYADDITRKMVAGRGIGEVPLVQKSKIFQLVAPFQLEVGNAWYVLGDFVKRKDFGAIATLLVANYLFNRAAEQVRGTPVIFDPIQALIDGSTDAADELQAGSPERAALKFTGRQVGEILSNIPFGQTVAAALPDDFVKNQLGFQGGKQELFGSANPGRFGSGLLVLDSITDPLARLALPFGGVQVKRTYQGIESMLQRQVKDSKGNLSFNTNATPLNVAQAVLFGKNATAEAQDFYTQRDDLFQRIYRQDARRNDLQLEAESTWADVKKLPKDQAIAKMQSLEQSDPALADAVASVAQDEKAGLTGTERLIKMLGVDNGERAKYIADTAEKLSTREDQVKYLQELDDKGLISDQVFQQLQVLLKGKLKPKQ